MTPFKCHKSRAMLSSIRLKRHYIPEWKLISWLVMASEIEIMSTQNVSFSEYCFVLSLCLIYSVNLPNSILCVRCIRAMIKSTAAFCCLRDVVSL